MAKFDRAYMDRVPLKSKRRGYAQRVSYQNRITDSEPLVPKCVTYEDIDKSFFDFAENELAVNVQGVSFPTFKLFSNQRFSEYSQTWKHTDQNGNLIVNFKTVSRESNPKKGEQQGGYYNIPGERWYEYMRRDVLEDNGDESLEVYSVRQPFAVDLVYKVHVIASKFEYLNMFNMKAHDLFKSRQCYIRPNGHFLPMTIEDVSDESEHELNERKFFSQCFTIRVMGYITRPEDLRIQKYPKRVSVSVLAGHRQKHERVAVYETEGLVGSPIDVEMKFPTGEGGRTISFTLDTDMKVNVIDSENVRSMVIKLDGVEINQNISFSILYGTEVNITIVSRYDSSAESSVTFSGETLKCKHKENESETVQTE